MTIEQFNKAIQPLSDSKRKEVVEKFAAEFNEQYETYYNDDSEESYRDEDHYVEKYDSEISRNPASAWLFKALYDVRFDIISSDREAASFAKVLENFSI